MLDRRISLVRVRLEIEHPWYESKGEVSQHQLKLRTSRGIWAVIWGSLLISSCRPAQVEIGLQVGDQAADFRLQDQSGRLVSLEDLLKNESLTDEKLLALVFFRSADW